ncbi:MAG: hypothetical protein JOZ27_00710 [Caulobacteraceae bacterium]|nr:hypothetical protein [Caulobacteraceae bacterium]
MAAADRRSQRGRREAAKPRARPAQRYHHHYMADHARRPGVVGAQLEAPDPPIVAKIRQSA